MTKNKRRREDRLRQHGTPPPDNVRFPTAIAWLPASGGERVA